MGIREAIEVVTGGAYWLGGVALVVYIVFCVACGVLVGINQALPPGRIKDKGR